MGILQKSLNFWKRYIILVIMFLTKAINGLLSYTESVCANPQKIGFAILNVI